MCQKKKMFSFHDFSKYRTLLMGLQILFIIYFHFLEHCRGANINFGFPQKVFYTFWGSSGVDLFLLLSGMGLYFSWKKNPDPQVFYRKRFSRIFVPYFLVAIPGYYFLELFAKNGRGWLAFFKKLSFFSFFTEHSITFWYIIMSFFCYLIFPVIFKIVDEAQDSITEKMRVLVLCITSTMLCVVLFLYNKELFNNLSLALTRFPAFFVGVLFGKAAYEKREMPTKNIWILTVISFCLILLGLATTQILNRYAVAFFNLCVCFLLILALNYIAARKSKLIALFYKCTTGILCWFGKYTIELYLLHIIIRKIMKYYKLQTYQYSVYGSLFILSILLSLVLHWLSDLICKKILKV